MQIKAPTFLGCTVNYKATPQAADNMPFRGSAIPHPLLASGEPHCRSHPEGGRLAIGGKGALLPIPCANYEDTHAAIGVYVAGNGGLDPPEPRR